MMAAIRTTPCDWSTNATTFLLNYFAAWFWPGSIQSCAVFWIRIGFNAGPDPAFYFNADPDRGPDPGRQTNADPGPGLIGQKTYLRR
jgi:hypothetical protein